MSGWSHKIFVSSCSEQPGLIILKTRREPAQHGHIAGLTS